MTNILEEIIAHKKMEIAALDVSALRRAAESAPAPRDFLAALSRRRLGLPLSLIAETQARLSLQRDARSAPRLDSNGRHLCR